MRGSCLCGAVTYEAASEPRSVVGCHCTQCRKTSGHHVAATQVRKDDLVVRGDEYITWYRSSATAQRAFCRICGSQLFWTEIGSENISIMAGTLDGPTGLRMDRQLYPEDKGDYYDLPDVEVVEQQSLKPGEA